MENSIALPPSPIAPIISTLPSAPVLAAAAQDILEHGLDLLQHQVHRHHFHAANRYRVLNRKQSDDGLAVDAELVKRLQVGLDPRARRKDRSRQSREPPLVRTQVPSH